MPHGCDSNLAAYTLPSPGVRKDLKVGVAQGAQPSLLVDQYGNPINSENRLPVAGPAVRSIDIYNSWKYPLPENGRFQGLLVSTLDAVSLIIHIITDVDSAVHGFRVEDYADIDSPPHVHHFSVCACEEEGVHYELTVTGKYYRIIYINGNRPQNLFILSSSLSKRASGQHLHDLNHEITDRHPATLVRSVGTGKGPDDRYINQRMSADGSLYAHLDPHVLPEISVNMARDTGTVDTIANFAPRGSTNLVMVGTNILPQDEIHLHPPGPSVVEYDHFRVTNTVGNVIYLDRETDGPHYAGEEIQVVSVDMDVIGSLASPVIYEYVPRDNQLMHIHALHLVFSGAAEPDLTSFGTAPGLVNGLHFRLWRPEGRYDTYWTPFRNNADFELAGFQFVKETKVGAAWFCHIDLIIPDDMNSIILIDGRAGEKFQAIVQDDVTANSFFQCKLSIHEENTISEVNNGHHSGQ